MRLHFLKIAAALASLSALAGCTDSLLEPGGTAAPGGISRQVCADCEPTGGGGGGGGGGTTTEPFNPPPSPVSNPQVPLWTEDFNAGQPTECRQSPYATVAFSNDVVRGTVLYPTGVVPKNSKINFHFYNSAGQLAKTHLTHHSHDNCVVQHEPEAMSTWDMAPGYYYIYASYWHGLYYLIDGNYYGYPVGWRNVYVGALRIR